jgi:hypothetical protein
MIEIEIIKSADLDFVGKWKFYKNSIYLGYPEADILVTDLMQSYAFMIEILPTGLQVIPHPKIEYWLLNGKRATQPRRIKMGDQVQVGETLFKVIDCMFVENKSKKEFLDEKLAELVEKQDPCLETG